MLPVVSALLGNGLSLIANAVLAKGTAYVKEKTGIDLSTPNVSDKDMVALKQYEMEHEEELLKLRLEENKLDAELQRMYLQDLDSARDREARIQESAHASWLAQNATPIFGMIGVGVAFALFGAILYGGALEGDAGKNHKDVIVYVLGVLSAIVTQIFAYYFGSSSGSKNKQDQINRMMAVKGEKP
jgi:hypothetical protein